MLLIKKLAIFKDKKTLLNLEDLEIKSSLALVGQSGSGKSITLKAILNLLPSTFDVIIDIKSEFNLENTKIGFIPQNPFTSLSPLTKISKQFFCNNKLKKDMCIKVGLEENILDKFPSQLSGGQLQRVVVAIILSMKPKIILLDEPTTALDTKNKEIILKLLVTLKKEFNLIFLFVTHDIVSAQIVCDDIAILKNGKIIESGILETVIKNPKNKYTKELINSSFRHRNFRL